MTSRLFCEHCKKHYRVNLKNINLVKEYKNENLRFANNTYYYTGSCFFKDLNSLKSQHKLIGE